MNKNYQSVNACPLLRTPNHKKHLKSRRTSLFLSKPLLKCCPLISSIRHPSILLYLLNSCRNRVQQHCFWLKITPSCISCRHVVFVRENQNTSPEILHSAISVYHFFIKTMLILIYSIFFIKKVISVDICSSLFVLFNKYLEKNLRNYISYCRVVI